MTQTKLNELLRSEWVSTLSKFLEDNGEEVLRVKSNEIAIPCVDAEDNEKFIVFTIKVPTGTKGDNCVELYDGYALAEDYEHSLKEKAKKKAKAAELKAKKIEKDKQFREQQKLLKQKKEQRG